MLVWLVAGGLFLLWMYWFVFSRVEIYEVSTSAKLQVAQAPHTVSTLLPSKILSTKLTIGQLVQVGDILVELDANTQRLQLEEERARLSAIPEKIMSLKSELASLGHAKGQDQQASVSAMQAAKFRRQEAVAVESFAKDHARRLAQETAVGSVAKVEALRAEAEAQKMAASSSALMADAQKMENDARMRLDQNNIRIENARRDLQNLENELLTRKITVVRLQEEMDKYVLRAPIAGRVGDVLPLKVGAYVAEGQKLATIVPEGNVIIVADFLPAAVMGRIKVGQTSRMRLDGFPWSQYGTIKAQVNKVSTEVRDNLVRVELIPMIEADTKALLQHGLPGSVEVKIEQIPPYILVLRTIGQKIASPHQATITETPPSQRASIHVEQSQP